MNDKIVTHEDLPSLLQMRQEIPMDPTSQRAQILDRLIAAAEADQPPLPEGWVLLRLADGTHRALWHEGGCLYLGPDGGQHEGDVGALGNRDRLTPLRPTVTEADVDRAREAGTVAAAGTIAEQSYALHRRIIRAALDSLGIEVTP